MASFESVNYSLRPNKHVQRKLMIATLRELAGELKLEDYQYVGLGSLWYVDFILAHRELGIGSLVSIESESPDRAEFNRPFDCVHVEAGDSTSVLRNYPIEERRAVVWLDYDSRLDGPVFEDIGILMSRAVSGSIVVVTVDARVDQVKDVKGPDGQQMDREAAIKYIAGDRVPSRELGKYLTRRRFPDLVAEILQSAFLHELRISGREEDFLLLFNFRYADGAPMVTVGGIIADGDTRKAIDDAKIGKEGLFPPGKNPHVIDVPILTPREKLAMDRLLPRSSPITEEAIRETYGFTLKKEQMAGFEQFYLQYPLYGVYEL